MPATLQPTRVIQLTDSHLYANSQTLFRGIEPHKTLQQVVAQVVAEHGHSDLLLATGDLAQDGSVAAYEAFLQHTQAVAHDRVWLPGNHDEAHRMLQWPQTLNRPWVDCPGWRLVFLNSAVPHQAWGELNAEQWQCLTEALADVGSRAVMLVLHHHLVPTGSVWMDQLMVQNADTVRQRLQDFPQIKVVLCGHIHQTLEKIEAGIHYLGTPATSVQFLPMQDQFALDSLPPGYRWLKLWPDGTYTTEVAYLRDAAPAG